MNISFTKDELNALSFAVQADLEVVKQTIIDDGYGLESDPREHGLFPQAAALQKVLSKIDKALEVSNVWR